jgi:quinol monooxygenase YgiN
MMAVSAVWATMQARNGREEDARAFPEKASRRMTELEPGVTSFHAMELGEDCFAIFNTFAGDGSFLAHAQGPTAARVQAQNPDSFTKPYATTRAQVFAAKPHAAGTNPLLVEALGAGNAG